MVIIRASRISDGPYVIKKFGTEGPAFRVTFHVLKKYEEGAMDENLDFVLDLPE